MSSATPTEKHKMIKIRTRKPNSLRKQMFLLRVLSPHEFGQVKNSAQNSDLATINQKSPVNLSKFSDIPLEATKESPNLFKTSPNFSQFTKLSSRLSSNKIQTEDTVKTEKIKLSSKGFTRSSMNRRSTLNTIMRLRTVDPDEYLQQIGPLSPEKALDLFTQHLTKFEQTEILSYKQVYYIGMKSSKINSESNEINSSFDDQYSYYKIIPGDHIAYRYEVQELLGKGVFGVVCKCLDHKTKKQAAIKLIKNDKNFYKQANVEISVLECIKKNDTNDDSQCIHLKSHFLFRKHICLTFDLLSVNLHNLLKSSNFRGFSLTVVRRIIAQVVSGLIFLKNNKIIHCDLKPENIVLKEFNKTGIKIIDFSSSCFENEGSFDYIQSRYYRAPEVLLGIGYISAVDMWSLGCIAAELCAGLPIFPGENEAEQIWCIMEYRGMPPKSLVEKASTKKEFFDWENLGFENSKGVKRVPGSKTLRETVKVDDINFLDFIEKCLEWNPYERMTPEQAFYHEFIQEELRSFTRTNN